MRRLGALVRLITAKASDDNFKIGLENVEGWTGRLLGSNAAFEGEGVAFEAGDVLFGKLRPYLAKVWVADRPGAAVGDFLVLRPRTQVSSRFLARSLLRPECIDAVSSAVYGAKMPRVSWEILRDTSVPVTPYEDGESIANYLDRETAEIDAFMADQEELIALLEERRAATTSRLIDELRAPRVPLRRLLSRSLEYGIGAPADSDDPAGIRYLRITDFDAGGRLRDDTFRSLPRETAAPYLVNSGDILIARSGATVGKSFLVPENAPPSCFAGYLIRIVTDRSKLLPQYLHAYLQSSDFERWRRGALVASTIENIGASRYAALPIPLPPPAEQIETVRRIRGQDGNVDAAIADAREAIALSKERRAALISAAVTGQIDVTEKKRVLI